MAKAYENASKQADSIEARDKNEAHAVKFKSLTKFNAETPINPKQKSPGLQKSVQKNFHESSSCNKCGNHGHVASSLSCTARGQQSRNCLGYNHFAHHGKKAQKQKKG